MRVQTEIDEDLERRPVDADELERAIEQKERDADSARQRYRQTEAEADLADLGRAQQQLAEYRLLADRGEQALRAAERACSLWSELGRDRAGFLAELRRAEAMRKTGRAERASETLDALVDRTESDSLGPYRDFALEARARARLDLGDSASAREDLERCLAFRRDRDRGPLAERIETMLDRLDPAR